MLSKLEQAKQILDESLLLIRYPDNGYHICRWCHQSKTEGHTSHCWYAEHTKAIDAYREKVKAYLATD